MRNGRGQVLDCLVNVVPLGGSTYPLFLLTESLSLSILLFSKVVSSLLFFLLTTQVDSAL